MFVVAVYLAVRCTECYPLPQMPDALVYARVSSKDQEREGFSIPAQLELLRHYATDRRLRIVQEFVDVETAKQAGRAAFGQLISFVRKHPRRLVLLVEKTDRLYRNLRDWVTVDELDLEIHLVKENVMLSPESRSHEKFMHGIKVLMAKNYVDNLSEEIKKSMLEKARQGIWPSFAPIGYRNIVGPGGKRIIEPDPAAAPIVARLFDTFAKGNVSIKELARAMRAEAATLRGQKLYTSFVHRILRKRIYCGDFDFGGVTYRGTYAPIVPRETWERVQRLLDRRAEDKTRKVKHEFALTGLVHCGHCGCLMVGELKKARYVYYHCTGNRGRCGEPYVRQERLEHEFAQTLRQLSIAPATMAWLERTAAEMETATEQVTRRLKADYDRLQARIETMYLDKLDGRIDSGFYDQKAAEWRRQQRELQAQMTTGARSATEAVGLIRQVSTACGSFDQQPSPQKRKLIEEIVEKASWQNGELRAVLTAPFSVLARSNSVTQTKEREKPGSGHQIENWRRGGDSNRILPNTARNLQITGCHHCQEHHRCYGTSSDITR